MTQSNTKMTPDETERSAAEEFCLKYSSPAFRRWFNHLYPWWREFNKKYFDSKLILPHISLGRTHPRKFSEMRLNTDYGAPSNLVISERVVLLTAPRDRAILTTDINAEGLLRFVKDRILGEMVKQFVLQVRLADERTWGGYGPLYCAEATRIGADPDVALPEVHPRRRGLLLAGMPVAAHWPHAYRDEDYYMGDVSFSHRQTRGRVRAVVPRQSVVPGVFEYLYLLAETGQIPRLKDTLYREVESAKIARDPALKEAEEKPSDPSGMPIPMPSVEEAWLHWNGGCVRAIAEGIRDRKAWDGMPILADALQEAGCEDPVLLGHCRAHRDHTSKCWALKLLLDRP